MGRISRPVLTSCAMLVTPSVVPGVACSNELCRSPATPHQRASRSRSIADPPRAPAATRKAALLFRYPRSRYFVAYAHTIPSVRTDLLENRDPSEADSGEGQDQYQEASELGVWQLVPRPRRGDLNACHGSAVVI